MKRDLNALADTTHDLLIVGGGIHGSIAAGDAVLRGLSVALIERADFGGATSANSLRIVHGGLRYLQTADFKRMRESIRERRAFLRVAPHLVRPLGFLVATHGASTRGRAAMRVAMAVADLIGLDRNRGLGRMRHLPAGRLVSRARCIELCPLLENDAMTGGAIWHDAQTIDSERLTLSFLLSATEEGLAAANYVEARELIVEQGRVRGARVIDHLAGERFEIRAHTVLNAAGPWVERLVGAPAGSTDAPRMALGINLVVNRPPSALAVGFPSRTSAREDPVCGGGRYLFMTPWRERTLIGTAYRPWREDPDAMRVGEEFIHAFVDECNDACPALGLSLPDVSAYHRGLVWLKGREEPGLAGTLADRPRIVDHERDGLPGVISMSGVKYTTARSVAEAAIDRVAAHVGRDVDLCRTATTPVYGGEAHGEPRSDVERRLVEAHGSRASKLAAVFADNPGWSRRSAPALRSCAAR